MFDQWLIQYGAVGVILMGMIGGIMYLFGDSKSLRDCLTKTKARVSVAEVKQTNFEKNIEDIKDVQIRIFEKIDKLHDECIKLNKR